ncbi:MAG: hypothetical protein IAE82_02200, partial [Opitutaceae bacterium]|nr:hypothetical protein [Opitutaceae bacterium]
LGTIVSGTRATLRGGLQRATIDAYFNALFVFTAARVEANWGSTGKVICIRDDQLHDYIVDFKARRRLTAEEVTKLAQAFLALAHMDREFGAPHGREEQKPSSVG